MYKESELNNKAVVYLGDYHKYKLADGSKNPNFDSYSSRILDVKIRESQIEINRFANQINLMIESHVAICYVPSSKSDKTDGGVRKLASKVASLGNHIDATGCLARHTSIDKLATGGSRHKSVHFNSIEVANASLIKGKKVLIIDDVTTSNNSLIACKELLEQAGAAQVYCLALGQTVSE